TGIAMQTATIILMLAIGVVASVPEEQPLKTLRDNSTAGLLARRALPVVIALPIVLGWLRVRGQQAGLYDTGMGTALLVLLLIVLLCALLWWCMSAVRSHELAERRSEQSLAKRASEQAALYQFTDKLHRATSF